MPTTGRITASPAGSAAGKLQTARATLKSLSETIIEKRAGCRILAEGNGIIGLDGLGWNHPTVLEYCEDLAFWEERRAMQVREIQQLEALAAQEAADLARFLAERAAAEAAFRAAGNTGQFKYFPERDELTHVMAGRRERDVARNRRTRQQRQQRQQQQKGA